jgi:hypothetical protein
MALCEPTMRSRKRSPSTPADGRERLFARIAELEQRIQLLEARVRRVAARTEDETRQGHSSPVRVPRPRPRCPGCLLELPKGRRGENCVWCGFYFEAVGRRAMK